jgi:hypothetical protein
MRSVALVLVAGCSFVGVRGPTRTASSPPGDPSSIKCSESDVLPALDALAGAAALGVMGGGILLEQTSEDGEPEHFTLYYAGPALAVAIAYFWSASYGTTRVSRCTELKEDLARVKDAVRPIEGMPVKRDPPEDGGTPTTPEPENDPIEMEPEKLDLPDDPPPKKPKPKKKPKKRGKKR